MVRIKRHRNARSRQETKPRHRKPNIPELVYKFLVAHGTLRDPERSSPSTKCRCCSREDLHEEVVDSADSPRNDMGYSRPRKETSGRRGHGGIVKRRPPDLPVSFLEKCVGDEGTRNARRYIKKALNFGVESGYLVPADSTYKMLRVSSNLMRSVSLRNKVTDDRAISQERDQNRSSRDTPTRLEDLQVQEQRRRRRGRGRGRRRGRGRTRSRSPRRRGRRGRRRRRRRRSRSRSRIRTREGSPQNPQEMTAEDEADDYEMEDEAEPAKSCDTRNDNNNNNDDDDDDGNVERKPKTARSNQPDHEEQSTRKVSKENGSDVSVDEDETDDEDDDVQEKKRNDGTKS